jgi:hypothetical protein
LCVYLLHTLSEGALVLQMTTKSTALAELNQLQKELNLLRQEELILSANGLKWYDPAGWKHDLFHQKGDFKFRYVRCGNRFGKTEMGVAEDVAWALGERPWYPKDHPARYAGIPRRKVRLLIIVESWKKADDVLTNFDSGKFWKYIPKASFVDTENDHGGNLQTIRVKSIWGGNSLIKIDTIATYRLSPQSMESSQWDAIHIDEPCPEKLWTAVSRGLIDTGGKAWFTCTPLIHPWINRFFIPSGKDVDHNTEPFANSKKFIITGSSYDNKYNTKENIDDILSDIKKEERDARLFGIPSGAGGIVYSEFDRHLHIFDEDSIPHGWSGLNDPPPHYMMRAAIDTHERTPQAVLHEATISDGRDLHIYYFAEQFDSRYVDTTCHQFNTITMPYVVQQILFDPRAYIESPVDDSTLADVFMSYGIVGEKAIKDPKRAIITVKAKLKERTDSGKATIHFASNLVETLYEFENYLWDPKKANDPLPENNHMMENLGRLLMSHPGVYIDPNEKNETHFGQVKVVDTPNLDLNVSLSL